jgi:guanylate kinase
VISGPSGVGKTTLVDELVRADPLLRRSVSATTRPLRRGEVEGEDYFFVDEAEFNAMKDDLIEWAEVHGFLYGTPRRFVEEQQRGGFDPVLNIDVQGGIQAKKAFPHAVLIFILPPSLMVLEARMRGRGDVAEEEIQHRLDNARKEIDTAKSYDYLVINDTVAQAVTHLKAIIKAERCRRERFIGSFITEAGK